MCTVTLEYDQNNALARRKLAALIASGLFVQLGENGQRETGNGFLNEKDERKAWREERDSFLYGSKMLAAKAFAGKL